eukprot:5433958-Pyramimonas_sp.AAC.1
MSHRQSEGFESGPPDCQIEPQQGSQRARVMDYGQVPPAFWLMWCSELRLPSAKNILLPLL